MCCSFKRISARGQTHDQLGFAAPCCSGAALDVPPQSRRRPPSHAAVTRSCFDPLPLLLFLVLLLGLRAPGWDDEDAPAAASSSSRPSVRPRSFTLFFWFVQRGASHQPPHLVAPAPHPPPQPKKKKKKKKKDVCVVLSMRGKQESRAQSDINHAQVLEITTNTPQILRVGFFFFFGRLQINLPK